MAKFLSKSFGTVLFIVGIVLFVYFLYSVLHGTYDYEIIKTIIVIIIISIVFLAGIMLYNNPDALRNFFLLITTIFVILIIFEVILSTGYFDNLDSDTPIWIPYRYRVMDEMINKKHFIKSSKNKYGFNDINRSYKRKLNISLRIAVLGDSFIWGTGVADSVIWSHRLQKIFNRSKVNVEVLNWGREGWSTKDERDFLFNTGYKFDIDMLIVAVGANDVDSGKYKLRKMIHPQGEVYKILQKSILKIFPNSVSFIIDYLNAFSNQYLNYGYSKWLNVNYSEENLTNWAQIASDIVKFGKKNNIKVLFALLPENYGSLLQSYFSVLDTNLYKLKANYVNLYPVIEKRLKKYANRQLWANPADGHPGELVTQVYAEYICSYLLKNYKSMFYN